MWSNVAFQVDIRMGPEQERLNRFRQQYRSGSNRSRRRMGYDEDDDDDYGVVDATDFGRRYRAHANRIAAM